MAKLNICILLCLFQIVEGQATRSWKISPDILKPKEQSIEKPKINKIFPGNSHKKIEDINALDALISSYNAKPSSTSKLFSFSTAHHAVNAGAMLFAFIKIYYLYRHHYLEKVIEPEKQKDSFFSNKIKRFYVYICENFFMTLGKHGQFFLESSAIIAQAFIYKTVLKLILICGHRDIFDLRLRQRLRKKAVE